jgi:site-specific DNA recombinase
VAEACLGAADPGKGLSVRRCAIYTRKSTEERLGQSFNSLDAQREAAEAYIASQRQQGWVLLPEGYDDGGFSGASMERPALQRLLQEVRAGRIHCIVVYKVDRLSRSLLHFARLIEIFDAHGTSFVSVTQQFNTTTSLGRLTLNILLSFAQFEREIIAERTRDKMSAARRKGKWAGGIPVLGYDVDPQGGRLLVNPGEAEQVRATFDLYVELGSLLRLLEELRKRRWTTKQWMTRNGRQRPGQAFTRNILVRLLTNIIYTGKVRHKGAVYQGEHAGIVEPTTWDLVNERLQREPHEPGATHRRARNRNAVLAGLLYCGCCGGAMMAMPGKRSCSRHRAYVCSTAESSGPCQCLGATVCARQIEQAVLDRLETIDGIDASASQLSAQGRKDLVAEWVSRVSYDGRTGRVQLQLRPPNPVQAEWANPPEGNVCAPVNL